MACLSATTGFGRRNIKGLDPESDAKTNRKKSFDFVSVTKKVVKKKNDQTKKNAAYCISEVASAECNPVLLPLPAVILRLNWKNKVANVMSSTPRGHSSL